MNTVLCPQLPVKSRIWTEQFLLPPCACALGTKLRVGCGYQWSGCAWWGCWERFPFMSESISSVREALPGRRVFCTAPGWVQVHNQVSWVLLQRKWVNSNDRRDVGVCCWLRKKGVRYLSSEVTAVYYLSCNPACRLPSGTRALSREAHTCSEGRAVPHPEKGFSPTELSCLSSWRTKIQRWHWPRG